MNSTTPVIRGLKRRDRIREALSGRTCFTPHPEADAPRIFELLIICRGMKSAVERNRAKRRMRAAMLRLAREDKELPGGVYVLRTNPADSRRNWDELCKELEKRIHR